MRQGARVIFHKFCECVVVYSNRSYCLFDLRAISESTTEVLPFINICRWYMRQGARVIFHKFCECVVVYSNRSYCLFDLRSVYTVF
ncbi:unnamed protein product [Acanthoscelides obtectus]|uniref:Uncharacterized protein n=1 Tax=Acanthoscelides obtectus TaxID=200917 RepID=A0A9P0JZX4_ACAOB|nr:unnamed protein product [Acanthoscelides obtectus]CAK1649370.1 hypothetical protein AOBTE_LOCUS16191 [Acanthoscelides obtectus]